MQRELMIELAQGDPGALSVCVMLLKARADAITLEELKEQGVFGADIWLLYKDECGEDLEVMQGVLAARTAYATLKGNRYFSGYNDSAEQSK